MTARSDILTRLRQGLADAPVSTPLVPDRPEPFFTADWDTLAESFERVHVGFTLVDSPEAAQAALRDLMAAENVATASLWDHPLLAALHVADTLEQAGVRIVSGACCTEAAEVDCGITTADAVLPEAGSIVVRALPSQPRSTSLVPPLHVALVRKEDLLPGGVDDLPKMLTKWKRDGLLPSAVHCITGPSSTADIEQTHVRGVHGPTKVRVLGLDFPLRSCC